MSQATNETSDVVRIGVDEPFALDVMFCDIMRAPSGAAHGEPLELRFRGQRADNGRAARVYFPISEIEGALLEAGVIPTRPDTANLPAGNGPLREVKLEKFALTFTKKRKGNGVFTYLVAVRHSAQLHNPEGYLQALKFALGEPLDLLQKRGFIVSTEDVINIADRVRDRARS